MPIQEDSTHTEKPQRNHRETRGPDFRLSLAIIQQAIGVTTCAEAEEWLYQRTQSAVSRWVFPYSTTISKPEMEELVHEIYIEILMSLGRMEEKERGVILDWIKTITGRFCTRYFDRKVKGRKIERMCELSSPITNIDLHEREACILMSRNARKMGPEDYDAVALYGEEVTQLVVSLLQQGSSANLARARGVSRAAISQRIDKTLENLDALRGPELAIIAGMMRQKLKELEVMRTAGIKEDVSSPLPETPSTPTASPRKPRRPGRSKRAH